MGAPAVPGGPGAVRDQRGAQRLALVGRDRVQLAPEHALDLGGLCLPRRGQPAGHRRRLVLDQQPGAPHAADLLVEARRAAGRTARSAPPAAGSSRSAAAWARRGRTARARPPRGAPRDRGSAGTPSARRRRPARRSPRPSASGGPRRAARAATRPAPGACARPGRSGRRAARRWRPSEQYGRESQKSATCGIECKRPLDANWRAGLLILETRTERKERSQRL